MSGSHLPPALAKLSELQVRYSWRFLVLGLVSLLPALWGMFGLGFRPDFAELLPDKKESVIEMRRVAARLPGSSTLTVVAEIDDGANRAALMRFVDALVPRLLALGPDKVGVVDHGVKDARAFFEEHALLFARIEDLRQARGEVVASYDYHMAKASGMLVDPSDAPRPVAADWLERYRTRAGMEAGADEAPPYPDGYYMNSAGTFIAVLIRTPVTEKAHKAALRQEVDDIVRALGPTSFDPTMRVAYTGRLITGEEEYDAVVGDLMHVGGFGVAAVLACVFLFFLRFRTLAALAVTIAVSLAWTFGLTRVVIGYLNASTGFLVSIIAGNGINYGIMYMARYVEARREACDVAAAVRLAHRDSWRPTLAGSVTAMLAYGSLALTDFRGFKQFGIISAYGMILCWLATYLLLPAFLAASERLSPAFDGRSAAWGWLRGRYAVGFAKIARAAPRTIVIVAAMASVVCLCASARYLAADWIEYDMKNVRNARDGRTTAAVLDARVDTVVGRLGQDGMAIMTERLEQVPLLEAALEERRRAAPEGQKPFERVVTIHSLLPTHQAEKIALIAEMRDRIERARRRGFISDEHWAEHLRHLPAGDLRPLTIADLPEQVARPFTERDGTRGTIVYIVPTTGASVWDAHYLMRWADSYRRTELSTGEMILGSGSAVIYADMIATIAEDTPRAIAFSALGSIVVLLVAFRLRRGLWGVLLPWLLGIAGLFTYLHVSGTKLNFLNFVAVPITVGIGAEYAHNMMQRYRSEGPGRIYHVTVETGGAVVLCSLTTTIGYLALTLSINQGIKSFAIVAAVGELAAVLAAVVVLPAALFWSAKRARPIAAPSIC